MPQKRPVSSQRYEAVSTLEATATARTAGKGIVKDVLHFNAWQQRNLAVALAVALNSDTDL